MARGRKSSLRIVLSPEERQTLERWQRSTTITAGLVRRGKMILLLAAGHSQSHVAQAVGSQRTVVRKWARRSLARRLDGLADAPGRVPRAGFPPDVAIYVVRLACEAQTRWAAASPSGIVLNWHASSSRLGSLRTSPRQPCGGFWPAINSSRGATIVGSTPSTHWQLNFGYLIVTNCT